VSRRRSLLAGAAVVAVLVAILVLSNPRDDPFERPALDPRGTNPEGTAALVALLREQGATVRLGGLPDLADEVVLQLEDTLSGAPATELEDWVSDGGTLVLANAFADLAATSTDEPSTPLSRRGSCDIDALADLERIDPLQLAFATGPDSSSCVSDGRSAAVDLRRLGDGLVASVSSTVPFTNRALGQGDNAVLVTALLGPDPTTRIRILDPSRLLGDDDDVGDGTILGALPLRGSQAVSQLVIAFGAWALIRSRRLGRPVTEELPVPLPASDLVLASSRLLDRNGDVADAAERLRRRSRRDLGVAVGLGPDPPPADLANALRGRANLDPGLIHAALLAPVTDEASFVATSAHLDRLRRDLYQ